jgi:hypothetical protein
VGSELVLDSGKGATIWWQKPEGSYDWCIVSVEALDVRVVGRELNPKGIMTLLCQAPGGVALWSIYESEVIDKKISIKKLVNGPIPTAEPPAPGVREVEVEVEETPEDGRMLFGAAVVAFHKANEAKLAAEKKKKLVEKETRPIVEDYLFTNGKETKEGKEDFQITDFGVVAHIYYGANKTTIQRDDEAIIEWCLKNKQLSAISQVVNVEGWNALKEQGVVPADFIREVEEPVEVPGRKTLKVTRDKGWKWGEHRDVAEQLQKFQEENELDFDVEV